MIEDRIRNRLAELKHELQFGSQRLQELEREEAHLPETIFPISGSIQVLEEPLSNSAPDAGPGPTGVMADAKGGKTDVGQA